MRGSQKFTADSAISFGHSRSQRPGFFSTSLHQLLWNYQSEDNKVNDRQLVRVPYKSIQYSARIQVAVAFEAQIACSRFQKELFPKRENLFSEFVDPVLPVKVQKHEQQ